MTIKGSLLYFIMSVKTHRWKRVLAEVQFSNRRKKKIGVTEQKEGRKKSSANYVDCQAE